MAHFHIGQFPGMVGYKWYLLDVVNIFYSLVLDYNQHSKWSQFDILPYFYQIFSGHAKILGWDS